MKIGDTVKVKPPHEQDLVGEIVGFESWPRARWNNGGESTCSPGAIEIISTQTSMEPQQTVVNQTKKHH